MDALEEVGSYEDGSSGLGNLYFSEFDIRFSWICFVGSVLSSSRMESFGGRDRRRLGRFALGKSALLPTVDSETARGGSTSSGWEADFYSLRCLRHSRMAGIRGGRHSAIALGFPGKFMMSVWPATPATARERIAVGARGKLVIR